eukprot:2979560-Amphidinium_carterae.1
MKGIADGFMELLRAEFGDLNRFCLEVAVGKFGDGSPFSAEVIRRGRRIWFNHLDSPGVDVRVENQPFYLEALAQSL